MEGQTKPTSKLKFIESKKKIRVENKIVQPHHKLIAAANNHNLTVIGCEDNTIKYIETSQLFDFTSTQPQVVNQPATPLASLTFRPTLISVARYGYSSVLLVAGASSFPRNPVIEVFDLDTRSTIDRLNLNDLGDAEIIDYAWHPNYHESIVALCTSAGHLLVLAINKQARSIGVVCKYDQYGALTCCWSMKGKNLAIGTRGGQVLRLEPVVGEGSFSFKEVNGSSITFVNPRITPEHQLVRLRWMNQKYLIATHARLSNPGDPQTVYSVLTVKPDKPYLYWNNVNFESKADSNYVIHMANLSNSVVCISSATSEAATIGLLGANEATTNELNDWSVLIVDEEGARIELPLDANNAETHPCGLTLTTWPEDGRPILIIYTNDGLICPYAVMHGENILKFPEHLNQPQRTFTYVAKKPIAHQTSPLSLPPAFGAKPTFYKSPSLGPTPSDSMTQPQQQFSFAPKDSSATQGSLFSSGLFGAKPPEQQQLFTGLQASSFSLPATSELKSPLSQPPPSAPIKAPGDNMTQPQQPFSFAPKESSAPQVSPFSSGLFGAKPAEQQQQSFTGLQSSLFSIPASSEAKSTPDKPPPPEQTKATGDSMSQPSQPFSFAAKESSASQGGPFSSGLFGTKPPGQQLSFSGLQSSLTSIPGSTEIKSTSNQPPSLGQAKALGDSTSQPPQPFSFAPKEASVSQASTFSTGLFGAKPPGQQLSFTGLQSSLSSLPAPSETRSTPNKSFTLGPTKDSRDNTSQPQQTSDSPQRSLMSSALADIRNGIRGVREKLEFNGAYITLFEELNHLRDRFDETIDLHRAHYEALEVVKDDIDHLDLEVLETFYLIEYVKSRISCDIKKKSIDPITTKKVNNIKIKLKQIGAKLEELNDHVDVAWEDFVRRRSTRERRTITLDAIYKALATNQKIISVLKRKVGPEQPSAIDTTSNTKVIANVKRFEEEDLGRFEEFLASRSVVPVRQPVPLNR